MEVRYIKQMREGRYLGTGPSLPHFFNFLVFISFFLRVQGRREGFGVVGWIMYVQNID